MDAPQSKRFKALRRQHKELTGEAVKASIKSRRQGFFQRVFNFGGKRYQVTSVGRVQTEVATAASK